VTGAATAPPPAVRSAGEGAGSDARISDITAESARRVSAHVNGRPLWFASGDAALTPSPEAFATAIFVAALDRGARVVMDAPLSTTWRAGLPRVFETLASWWGYPALAPDAPERDDRAEAPVRRVGLCFSGGLDSFHTLLAGPVPIDDLIFVHGFDIDVEDAARYEAYLPSVREIARATGAEAVSLRTNVRAVWPVSEAPWDHTHGGPLIAAGHVLSDRIGYLVISSSIPYHIESRWGSHWRIDPHFGTARLRILHTGAHVQRLQKLRAVAHHPLVRRFLRVCWENRTAAANCGVCEKCVRTQFTLAKLGQLEHFSCFGDGSLASRLDDVPYFADVVKSNYLDYAKFPLPTDVRAAVERLIARTAERRGRPSPWRRAVRRFWPIR
jgi:hypothetical protein